MTKLKPRMLHSEKNSQMIVLMGITLAVSVFIISSIPSEISDLSATVPQARSQSLLPEFFQIKEIFGHALQYYLINIEYQYSAGDLNNPNTNYTGMYGKYTARLNMALGVSYTENTIYNIEIQYDNIFSADYKTLRFSHLTNQGHVYQVDVILTLSDGFTEVSELVTYNIVSFEDVLISP